MPSNGFVIAIDGPVAAGKGTIAPALAQKLGGFYLYTGAMYRCLALYCIENNIDFDNVGLIEQVLDKVNINFEKDQVFLNGENVTERIKEKDVASASSKIAVIPEVREEMVKKQRSIAQEKINKGMIVVAEGRDTATKVFKDAALKVYLTAKVEVRVKRRLAQLRDKGDINLTYNQVLNDVLERDQRDSNRKIDPLVKEPEKFGYFIVNNSDMNEKQTIDFIVKEVQEKGLVSS